MDKAKIQKLKAYAMWGMIFNKDNEDGKIFAEIVAKLTLDDMNDVEKLSELLQTVNKLKSSKKRKTVFTLNGKVVFKERD